MTPYELRRLKNKSKPQSPRQRWAQERNWCLRCLASTASTLGKYYSKYCGDHDKFHVPNEARGKLERAKYLIDSARGIIEQTKWETRDGR